MAAVAADPDPDHVLVADHQIALAVDQIDLDALLQEYFDAYQKCEVLEEL
jgi:hypothetical protein